MARMQHSAGKTDLREDRQGADHWLKLLPFILIAVLLLSRGAILFSGQRYLRSDEAVVGMMAKHVVTRGETPLFLYGQNYGGGHAILAYMAAPLFAVFGRSAMLLTGLTGLVALVNVYLVWLIMARFFNSTIALGGAALYAFSPPVVYQAFLINGGNESFCLALLGLYFFLRAYQSPALRPAGLLLAGLFAGGAYYAMDYALLYIIVFAVVWAWSPRQGRFRGLGLLCAGFAIGAMPLIIFNLAHDFANFRRMFSGGAGGEQPPLIMRACAALWHALTHGLPIFFTGEIDDYKDTVMPGPTAWLHMAVAIVAVVGLVIENGRELPKVLRGLWTRGRGVLVPVALLPLAFVVVYMGMYCVAGFSGPLRRTPRYFLPLTPFVSMLIAVFLLRKRPAQWARLTGVALVGLVAVLGLAASLQMGMRTWHEEHRIRTGGPAIRELAQYCADNKITLVIAPYEIQWRLMFESDEAILVDSKPLSGNPRYEAYELEARERFANGESAVLVMRKDMAYGRLPLGGRLLRSKAGIRFLRMEVPPLERIPYTLVGEEFMVFQPRRVKAALSEGVPFYQMTTP
jgi:Dolichyl-phosphate-mannose-protein mannosyltransferase